MLELTTTLWRDILLSFLAIILEGVPFLLLGAMVSALIDILIPGDALQRVVPRSAAGGVAAGIVAGFALPVCECGSVPVAARFMRKGVPTAATVTYLLAAPMLNPLVLASTWMAFQGRDPLIVLGLRIGGSLIVLLLLGWWIASQNRNKLVRGEIFMPEGIFEKNHDPAGPQSDVVARPGSIPLLTRFVRAIVSDFNQVLFFLVLGAAAAAFLSTALDRTMIEPFASDLWLGPIAGVALAQLLCLCSTIDAFVIASIPAFSLPAQLAFLIAGPILDIKLIILYRSVFQTRFIAGLWARATLLVLLLAWALALIQK